MNITMKKNYDALISNRYPTTAEGGLKTVGLDLRLHYIEFKSARYVMTRYSHTEYW